VKFANLNDSTSGARGDMERRETKNTSFVEKTREEGIRPCSKHTSHGERRIRTDNPSCSYFPCICVV
jgi:hypothetical protein